MKAFPTLFVALVVALGCKPARNTTAPPVLAVGVRESDTLLKFGAAPKAGFNFGYFVYLPAGLRAQDSSFLLVETNNGGLNDSIAFHERSARRTAGKSGVAHYVAKSLRIPLLVPVFPRSQTDWQVYTHALDRDALLSKDRDIRRLDLQLLAMIADARKRLALRGYPLRPKIFITGFSASGTFANRFSLLHPEALQATASGGINAMPILPVGELDGQSLNYPLGIADVQKITGRPPDLQAFRAVPKLLYMGALDSNDAVAFDDAYSAGDREIVYRLMGKSLIPQRWAAVQKVYADHGVRGEFRTYPGIGHGTDRKINDDLVEFFRMHSR